MILPNPKDAVHRAWLYRILAAFADDSFLMTMLHFKGGTCAAMRELIDRFSVDLDFDLMDPEQAKPVQKHMEKIFSQLGLEIKDQSKIAPQYFLKYPNKPGERNTVQIDVAFPPLKSNRYENVHLIEIDRLMPCQSIPTMFANKLATPLERFKKSHSIAGRDLYDIHAFFLKGFSFDEAVIFEKTGLGVTAFMKKLKKFIVQHVAQIHIDHDLNVLLPVQQFQRIRGNLKNETLMFLSQFYS